MTSPTTNTVTDELAEALKEALSWIEELYRSPMLHSISTEELRARPPRRITPIDDALAHYAALSTHPHTGTEDRATAREEWPVGWATYDKYPDADHRPGRQFIRMEGYCEHSGHLWAREIAGEVTTHNDGPYGYERADFDRLMRLGGMDVVERITHWMPYWLPSIELQGGPPKGDLTSPNPHTGGREAVIDWQPIETAPKDGRDILAFVAGFAMGQMVLFWEGGYWREKANCMGLKKEPTHWLPLPSSPPLQKTQKETI